jgi:hypothetical protein
MRSSTSRWSISAATIRNSPNRITRDEIVALIEVVE